MTNQELTAVEFDARIAALQKELDEATTAFESEANALALDLDTKLAATDVALEDFVNEVEKGDVTE